MGSLYSLRAFKPEDLDPAGFRLVTPTIGFAVLKDGLVAAVAGLTQMTDEAGESRHVAFFHAFDEEVRRHSVLIHRTTVAALAHAKVGGIGHVFVLCDEGKPRAATWLARLGFRIVPDEQKTDFVRMLEGKTQQQAWQQWL